MYQNNEIVIDFVPGKGVKALHMDEFPLSFLGRMKIDRASTIDFNPETQLFDINLKEATKYDHFYAEACNGCMVHTIARDPEGPWEDPHYSPLYPASAEGFTGYDEARRYEVAWIQECMKKRIDPLSTQGIEVIGQLRAEGLGPQL